MKKHKNDFSTSEGIAKAIDETIDTSKISYTDLRNISVLVIEAYYAGRESGILHMSEAWQKCNEKVFGKVNVVRVNENADAS